MTSNSTPSGLPWLKPSVLWLWVAAATAAYLYQFISVLPQILSIVGL